MTATRIKLSLKERLRYFLLGRPLFATAAIDDWYYRWVGIVLTGVIAYAYDIDLSNPNELLAKQLTVQAFVTTLFFVFLTWHLNLQVYYFEKARAQERPSFLMLKNQVIKGFLVTSGMSLPFAVQHLIYYGFTWNSIILGVNFFMSAQLLTAAGHFGYFLFFSVHPTKERDREDALLGTPQISPQPADEPRAAPIVSNALQNPMPEELEAALEKTDVKQPKAPLELKPQLVVPSPVSSEPVKLQIELLNKVLLLEESAIEHATIEDRVVFVYTKTGERLITRYETLSEFADRLSGEFFRINRQLVAHHSTVISTKKQNYGNLLVEFRLHGRVEALNVSRYRAQDFTNWLRQFAKQ